jgi:glycosyltransferase involved in cell wall biosynthesis
MKISVIIPTLNAERFLREALDSVFSQTHPPQEVIVVDGYSTDNTINIVNAFRTVRVLLQKSKGLWNAVNEGIDASSGELLAFLNSDDWWTPKKLELQYDILKRDPSIQFVIGMATFVEQPGELPASARSDLFDRTHVGMMLENLLTRRELFLRLGKFDPSIKISSDVDWFSRVKNLKVPYAVVPEVTIFRRLHNANLSFSQWSAQSGNTELLDIMRRKIVDSKKRK